MSNLLYQDDLDNIKACNTAIFLKKYLPSILQESVGYDEVPVYTYSSKNNPNKFYDHSLSLNFKFLKVFKTFKKSINYFKTTKIN